jgi:hypothetical protein
MMTPQLFINYKLKSVAHLPWRMLTYKALNTFIDDLFAFVIKMPTLYRLGCFRDGKISSQYSQAYGTLALHPGGTMYCRFQFINTYNRTDMIHINPRL